ncbi:MAG: hypothetical protein LBN19_02205 [Endomicrobium sp.]|jgi:hypothetical protein|nr:hypothetical protein [Endomicrobium sp.]
MYTLIADYAKSKPKVIPGTLLETSSKETNYPSGLVVGVSAVAVVACGGGGGILLLLG